MTKFLKKSPTPENQAALTSRGADRTAYLAKYVAWQLNKTKEKRLRSVRSETATDSRLQDTIPMCEHELRDKFGDAKADHWIEAGALKWIPDRFTGSSDPAVREYLVSTSFLVARRCVLGDCARGSGRRTGEQG